MLRRSPVFALALLIGIAIQAALWRSLAPAARCYLYEGECVFQASSASSPYFVRDLTFGLAGLAVGLVLGLIFAKPLWRGGPAAQVWAAVAAATASYAASQLGVIGSELTILNETFAIDALSLEAWGFVLAWPLGTQLAVLLAGPRFAR